MMIEFHCDHCGHMVRASDEHVGKRGKCPHCHQSVYIPTPAEEIEPLRVAPVDQNEERERQRLIEEARALAQKLREERGDIPEIVKGPAPEPLGDARLPVDMDALVEEYVVSMAAGKLAKAEALAVEIRLDLPRAEDVIQRLTMDELLPASLAKIPRAVVLGLIKQLRK